MRLFLISNMFPSNTDPLFGIFVQNFKIELEKQGIVFSKTVLIKGKAQTPLKKIIKYCIHYIKIVLRFFSYKYDLIYIHYLTHHIPILIFLTPFMFKPLVVNVHGSDIMELQNKNVLNYFAKIILKKVDLIVVPTSYFKELIMDKYSFIDSNKIFISPSGGIDSDKFYPKPIVSNKSILTLGFVSRFIEEKGWRTFLDALILIKKKGISFRAIIVGKGPDKEKILQYITHNNLKKEIDFKGLIQQEYLVDIYNNLNLYIFPTYREAESLGLTGLEAMSCGVPVIGCNIAGPSTYIKDEFNGYFFTLKDSTSLYNNILKYYNLSQKQKAQLSLNALKTAEAYNKEIVAEKLIARLQDIL